MVSNSISFSRLRTGVAGSAAVAAMVGLLLAPGSASATTTSQLPGPVQFSQGSGTGGSGGIGFGLGGSLMGASFGTQGSGGQEKQAFNDQGPSGGQTFSVQSVIVPDQQTSRVPEPAALGLFGLGLAAVMFRRRQRA